MRVTLTVGLACSLVSAVAHTREWSDSSGQYTVEADLVDFDDETVVLRRADHELAAAPIKDLSESDREYLKTKEATDVAEQADDAKQTWTLRDGTQVAGRVVDFAKRDMTVQRRRNRIYVNDRRMNNLPEFYQGLVPQIVAHYEKLPRADGRTLRSWLIEQGDEPQTFHLEGVVLESDEGDEFAVPFFLFSDEDLRLLQPTWDEWLAAHAGNNYSAKEDIAFLLSSFAAERQRDEQVRREIALMKLNLQAVQAGVTSLWEVTLYPAAGQGGPPLWVVVPGRDSRDASVVAMEQNPGYAVGPVRRVNRRR